MNAVIRVDVGSPEKAADFLNAIRNVEAELGYLDGRSLRDALGHRLPSILDRLIPSVEDQRRLLDAVSAIRAFVDPRTSVSETRPLPPPAFGAWSLDRLEKEFKSAIAAVQPQALSSLKWINDRDVELHLRIESAHPAKREVCVWSSLLHLAGKCAVLRSRPKAYPWATVLNAASEYAAAMEECAMHFRRGPVGDA